MQTKLIRGGRHRWSFLTAIRTSLFSCHHGLSRRGRGFRTRTLFLGFKPPRLTSRSSEMPQGPADDPPDHRELLIDIRLGRHRLFRAQGVGSEHRGKIWPCGSEIYLGANFFVCLGGGVRAREKGSFVLAHYSCARLSHGCDGRRNGGKYNQGGKQISSEKSHENERNTE